MTVFINPDRTNLPPLENSIPCNGLEALTGADIVISRLPVSPVNALPVHIARRSLFVQVKIGYDILSFDNLKRAIARMRKCHIPQQQCILLFIGRDWQDESNLLRIENSKPYGETTYKTFIKLKAKWRYRGGVVDWINDTYQLQEWVDSQLEAIQDIEDEGKREIYPEKTIPIFQPDNTWQEVEEIQPDDWRYFLCSGLDGFGSTTANKLQAYMVEELPHLIPGTGYYALKVLTEENEKGKPEHNIKGWGNKSRQKLRKLLGLPKGYNLSVREIGIDGLSQYSDGWYGALERLREEINKGIDGKDAWEKLMKMADDFCKDDIE